MKNRSLIQHLHTSGTRPVQSLTAPLECDIDNGFLSRGQLLRLLRVCYTIIKLQTSKRAGIHSNVSWVAEILTQVSKIRESFV